MVLHHLHDPRVPRIDRQLFGADHERRIAIVRILQES
jgi:hypothetical protein